MQFTKPFAGIKNLLMIKKLCTKELCKNVKEILNWNEEELIKINRL